MVLSYRERAEYCKNETARALFQLMEEKKSNLSVAADLTDSRSLLHFADLVGPEIVLLKTHIDILHDFSPEVIHALRNLADKHRFMIFEDRKFADIGQTVVEQYRGGIYKIANWAEITNAHLIPGPGIIEGLREVGLPKKRGLLLLAEMSSEGSLAKGEYTKSAVEWAARYSDFVIGFICQRKLSDAPELLHMTPGVQIDERGDRLGQRYQSPEDAIAKGSDLIIVGRGVYGAKDARAAARLYRSRAWEAYVARLSS